jgi:glutamate/tyrosine decarboxylase-like PLP-dependent enzyme
MQPFCIVGNAGTVNTGAFDDLAELAHICSEQNLWFHVDGAFGAWVAIADESKHLAEGMALADSIAFDLHKWMYMQYEVGCCLVRSAGAHRQTFAVSATYLTAEQRGFIAGPLPWREYGIQLSREFRALKVWMSLKEHGAGAYRKLIQQNIEQAAYLGKLIEADPHLELVAPIPSNVVCFRFHTGALDETKLNAINREILLRLQEGGIAVPSSTILNGKFAIRAAITNHRSTRADFDTLAQNVTRLGLELTNV